jgi:hypothetical protein
MTFSESEFLSEVAAVDWAKFDGPADYKPQNVPKAFQALLAVTEDTLWDAYHTVLFAIGNDHQGVYYPAAEAALPLLIKLAANSGNPAVQHCCNEILTDLRESFEPDPRFSVQPS